MYFQLTCEKCDKRIKVREEHAGKKVKCPHCHHPQIVRPPEPDPEDEPAFQIETSPSAPAGDVAIDTSGGRRPRPASTSVPTPAAPSGIGGESQVIQHDSGSFTDGTEVGLGISALFAVGGSVVFYALLFPWYLVDKKAYLPALFIARGWVPFVLVFFMAWSVTVLVMKYFKLQKQKDSMLFDLLPTDISKEITADNAAVFSRHVRGLPAKSSQSFLVNRVLRGLEHFRVLKSNSEVSDRLASQAEIDQNAVESSYTLLKVFIWAIPILGFIGTVIGISTAVGGFEAGMDNAASAEDLKKSLSSVTGGLSTAFDTTLVALVMSIFIMFPSSSMQKAEEDLLNWVSEYTNENLLKRLKDGKADSVGVTSEGLDDAALRRAVDAAMARHHAEIEAWSRKLEAIGTKITKEVVRGFGEVDEKISERQQTTARTAEQLGTTLAELGERTATVQNDVAASMKESAVSVRGYLTDLREGLEALNKVLVDLGGQQVVVQQNVTKKSGWSLFGRKNGR